MATFNFGAAASFQSFGAFAPQPQQSHGHQGCSCGTAPQPGYPAPTGYPTPQAYPSFGAQAPQQQSQVSAQFEIQMMMSYYMNMMSSMSQLQQGFGSFAGQQPSPYQLPTGGGYGGGYGGSGGGYAQAYPPVAQFPAPAPHVAHAPTPAPAPPAKKGGYA